MLLSRPMCRKLCVCIWIYVWFCEEKKLYILTFYVCQYVYISLCACVSVLNRLIYILNLQIFLLWKIIIYVNILCIYVYLYVCSSVQCAPVYECLCVSLFVCLAVSMCVCKIQHFCLRKQNNLYNWKFWRLKFEFHLYIDNMIYWINSF